MSPDITLASLVHWDNLWLAYRKAAKGKRGQGPAATFELDVADKLVTLQRELREGVYRPGAYVNFFIHEPKRRKISAAPFRDRVVHHALCNLIEPMFDRRFISHSYANRVGKGTHRALDCLQACARRYRYVLRADIVKHFPSLDHAILYQQIAAVIQDQDFRLQSSPPSPLSLRARGSKTEIKGASESPKDEGVLWLIQTILDSGKDVLKDEYNMVWFPGDDLFAAERPRGLPIGNLTSQFWSNVYMNPLDWFITRQLGCRAYVRYVDDFALFSDSKTQLYQWKAALIDYLGGMRLTIHEREAQVAPTQYGIPWLGFVVYPEYRLLKRRNAIHFTQRLEHNIDLYETGKISFAELDASVQGWINHVRYADTWGLRRHLFDSHPIKLHPENFAGDSPDGE